MAKLKSQKNSCDLQSEILRYVLGFFYVFRVNKALRVNFTSVIRVLFGLRPWVPNKDPVLYFFKVVQLRKVFLCHFVGEGGARKWTHLVIMCAAPPVSSFCAW